MAEQSEVTYEKLTTVTEAEAIKIINHHLSAFGDGKSDIVARLYLEELVRQRQDRANQRQEKVNQMMLDYTEKVYGFTKQMRNMTWIILVATVVEVIFTVLGFFWDAN